MSELLKFEVEGGVAVITLNRPEKLNAFTEEMREEWIAALDRCNGDDAVRAIVVTGTGRAFTTGGDIETFQDASSTTPDVIKARLTGGIQRLTRKLADTDKPVIAALNGFATGGGLDVALACDIRFAAESARFAETYARIGLIPGAGGAWFLPRIVGTAKALEMFWSCDWVDAREAERIGLVNRVFPDADLMDGALAFARKVAEGAPLAIQLTKRVLRYGLDKDLAAAQEFVATTMPVVRASEDHKEAVAAFRDKRTPRFQGR